MKLLAFDTETQGLPMWNLPSEDPLQPHICQLAALLVDTDTRKVEASMDVIIQPQGWTIPAEVTAIHGISTERALAVGVPEDVAVSLFMRLWMRADFRVAHNESFDSRIVRIALMRFPHLSVMADVWKAGRAECTQRLATPLMKLPPTAKMLAAGFNKPKSANLREAHLHFTGRELVDAHSAMADAQGCLAVYFAIQDRINKVEPGHMMSEAESAIHLARLQDAPAISPEVATP